MHHQIQESSHLVPPTPTSSASPECYSALGDPARQQSSPNRIGINQNHHAAHHADTQHSVNQLDHLQLQQHKHSSESSHSNRQEDTIYSHAPEYISL